MDIKPIIRLDEVPKTIYIPTPIGRKLVITSEESGVSEEQVFTSEDLPNAIPYELLGLVKFPDGNIHPKYRANVITSQLGLAGKLGAKNGINIINKVAWWLTYQEEIMLLAQSIKYSDLKKFDYKSEYSRTYWLASPGTVLGRAYKHFGPGAVISGTTKVGYDLSHSDGDSNECWLGVRPTMILRSKVQLDPPKISWVEL